MKETIKDAQKLADQLKAQHEPQVLRIAQLVLLVANLCPFMGHHNHELINECVLAYCEAKEIDIDAVNACIDAIQKAEATIAELSQLEARDQITQQGHGVGADFFKRFGKQG